MQEQQQQQQQQQSSSSSSSSTSSSQQRIKKVLTLVLLRQGNRILLGQKRRGFGVGKWNGFGGKVDKGETIEEAAQRELQEEAGITALDLEKRGVLTFEFDEQYEKSILEVHVFAAHEFSGTITPSEEMMPQWYDIDKIPFHEMWKDDPIWFPLFLESNKQFTGHFVFSDFDTIVKYDLHQH